MRPRWRIVNLKLLACWPMKIFLTFCFSFLLGTISHSQQKAGTSGLPVNSLTVYPASISFNLDNGSSKSQVVNIKNTTDKTYQLNVLLMDFNRDTLGEHNYLEAGVLPQSCAPWISIDKPFLEMAPGSSEMVTVTLKVPDSLKGVPEMKWTMLLFKTVTEKIAPVPSEKVSLATTQSMAIGVHIYQTPPEITHKEVKMLDFNQLPGGKAYRIQAKNVGGTQLSCKFSFELTAEATGSKTTLTSKQIPLFPNQLRFVDFQLPTDLAKGHYTILAMIDAEDDSVPIEAVKKEIDIN